MGSPCELWIDNVVNIIYKNIIKGYTVDTCIEEYYHIIKRIINKKSSTNKFISFTCNVKQKSPQWAHQIKWFQGTAN